MIESDDKKTNKPVMPASAILEMSFACNHSCIYCSCPFYAASGRYPCGPVMSAAEYMRMIDELVDRRGVRALTFSGGEALMHPELRAVIEYASKKECEYIELRGDLPGTGDTSASVRVGRLHALPGTGDTSASVRVGRAERVRKPVSMHLISNGALLDEGWLDFLKDRGVGLGLSLPGLRTYKLHTRATSCTPKKVLGLISSAARREMPVLANVTVTRANFGELFETIAEALLAGASFLLLNRFIPGGRGLNHIKELFMDPSQTFEAMKIADEVLTTAKRDGATGTEIPVCFYHGHRFERLAVANRCEAAREFFAIDAAGYIRACNHSPVRLSRWDDLDSLAVNPVWNGFVKKDYSPSECRGCSYIAECDCGCREAARLVSKRIDAADPAFTEYGVDMPVIR